MFVTQSQADAMGRMVANAGAAQKRLDEMAATGVDKFPAKLTGKTFDTTSGMWEYAWTEETYNAAGMRIDKPAGRTGTSAFMPARAYGDGNLVTTFPHYTTLRRRLVTATKGPVYEFPLYCACVAGSSSGSGSGSGDGGIVTTCCPDNPVPSVLHATLSVPGCGCGWDGLAVTLIYDPALGFWQGTFATLLCSTTGVVNSPTRRLQLACTTFFGTLPLGWYLGDPDAENGLLFDSPCQLYGPILPAASAGGCLPFWQEFTGTIHEIGGPHTCPCLGMPYTLIITE